MRLIDADKLHYNRIRIAHPDGIIGGYNAVVMSAEIKDAPTVDAVEVVRCEDCKWWDKNSWGCKHPGHGFAMSTPDFYCADGERKGGDE